MKFFDNFWEILIGATVIGAIFASVFMIACVTLSDGKIDHCYIFVPKGTNTDWDAWAEKRYVVLGHRPWRQDVTVDVTKTYEEAKKIANECAK